jgi:hypothetical protein
MLPELTQEEFAAALETVATEALWALDGRGPPIDARALAAALDITVAEDALQRQRARYVRLRRRRGTGPQASILVRPDPRPEREQWALAHEIGEHLAGKVYEQLGVDPREAAADSRESVANALAARLLLPALWFAGEARSCGWDLPPLKERFRTASHELIARRMLDFPPAAAIAIFDHGELTFRGANTSGRPPAIGPLEARCQRLAHERGRPVARRRGMLAVQAWPIHEPLWKREILRTVIDALEETEADAW